MENANKKKLEKTGKSNEGESERNGEVMGMEKVRELEIEKA